MDNKTNELRKNEIETVTGGITQEQFNQLPAGTRIRIIAGWHAGKEAVIVSFVNEWMRNVRSSAWIRFEDGSEESINPDEFEVVG